MTNGGTFRVPPFFFVRYSGWIQMVKGRLGMDEVVVPRAFSP